MKYVQLGKTDLQVSRICFGTWQMSPRFWGEISLEDWQNAVLKAVDLGVNFVDTADAYGDGYAESSLGDLLARERLRDKMVIATKFYWNFDNPAARFPDTSYEYILRACEASLLRLKTDHIDLYQIHSWDPLTQPEEVAAAFARLKKEGKVRWFGVSNMNAEQMRMYSRYYDIECLQPLYNMLERDVEAQELPFCLQNRMGVIVYSPLSKGILTGKYRRDQRFEDFRANRPFYREGTFQRIWDAVHGLQPIADAHGLTLPQLAARWVLTHPAVSCAIIGVKKQEHIESIVAAAEDILPNPDWHKAASAIAAAISIETD